MKSTQSKCAVAFLLFILIFSVTHFAMFPGSVKYFEHVTHNLPLLDLSPEFSVDRIYKRLDSFGNDGRAAYLKFIPTVDLIFPLSAFQFFLLFGRLAAENLRNPLYSRHYWTLASIYLLMDFLENASIALLLINYPEQLNLVASPLGFISVTKRVFMILSVVVPLFILSFVGFKHWRALHTTSKEAQHP